MEPSRGVGSLGAAREQLLLWLLGSGTGSSGTWGAAQGCRLFRSRRGVAPQEPKQGNWLPGSLRGLAPQEPEPGRHLPSVMIYQHPQHERKHNIFIFGTTGSPKNKFDLCTPSTTKFGLLIASFITHTSPNTLKELKKRLDGCLCVFPYLAHSSSIISVSVIAFFKDKTSWSDAFHVMNGGRFYF